MRIRLAYLICLLLSVSLTVQGQSLFGNQSPVRKVFNQQRQTIVRQPQRVGTVTTRKQREVLKERRDTALYLSLTKRFGWYYGIGRKLTPKELRHLPCYYRLTEPDSLGRFTKVEAVNGRGMLTTRHELSTYLIENDDENDNEADAEWKKMLQTVVQWELVPSGNRHLAMESGLDANGNLIYTYIMHSINDSIVVGHYTDAFGEPISLRKGKNVAKYVQVVLDEKGYERQILYLDDNAYFMRNTDGAYMQKKAYDDDGNTIQLLSCMMNGRPIKDRWGNCGWNATYNEWGQMLTKSYVDENLQPMRMPRHLASIDVMSRNFEYDSLHLKKREYYMTDRGRKDQTSEGVHSKEWQYDAWGNVLSVTALNTKGRLCNERNGIAQTFYAYDKAGRLISTCFKNKDSLFVNDASGLCMYIGDDTYTTRTGRDTIPVFKKVVSGQQTKTIDYVRQQIKIVKTDRQGRQIELAYYNLNMQPVEVDSCFRLLTTYRSDKNKQIQEEVRYAFEDTIRTVTVTDMREHTRVVQRFHDKTLLSSFGQTLDDNQEVTGQYGYDALGNRARSHLEDALYYRVKSGTTYRGANSYMMGCNEYDEPSYVVTSESSSSKIYCTLLYDSNFRKVYLDENNNMITENKALRDSLYKVYCIELLKPRAYQLGLRSGDILVKYGEFYYPQALQDRWTPGDQLQIETYLTRNTKKNVLVLRYDATLKKHKMVSLTLPPGTTGDLGFMFQMIHCTKRETERFNAYVKNYLLQKGIHEDDFVINPKHFGSKKVLVVRPFKVSTASMSSWKCGLREDVIILAVSNLFSDGTSTYTDLSDGVPDMNKRIDVECDSITLFFTTDGVHQRQVTLAGDRGLAISYSQWATVPADEYEKLEGMAGQLAAKVKDRLLNGRSKLMPESVFRYVKSKANTIGSKDCRDQEEVVRMLQLMSEQTGSDFQDKGITALKGIWVTYNTVFSSEKVLLTALQRLSTDGYESVSTESEVKVYCRRSKTDQTKYTEVVVRGRAFLFIFKGNITDSGLKVIKEAAYEKIH